MVNLNQKKVIVIADPIADDGERARYSYWKHIFPPQSYDEHSIADLVRDLKVLNMEDADIVIVNWDGANGDSVYRSDYTMQYFETHGRARTYDLLHRKGIVLCECQTMKGIPVQAAYDAIYGRDEIEVLRKVPCEAERRGNTARVVREYADHPVLKGINIVTAHYQSRNERVFHGHYTGHEEQDRPIMERYPDSVWFGWFTSWGKGWIPLLSPDIAPSYAEKQWPRMPSAVLVAKCVNGGLLLASTMWIAATGCEDLIRNIVNLQMDEVHKIHRRVWWRRFAWNVFFVASVVAFAIFAFEGFIRMLESHPFRQALAVTGTGLFALYSLLWSLCKFVLHRPYGVPLSSWLMRRLTQMVDI